MLEHFKKTNFHEEKGEYNANMCGDVRTLHKKNGCYYSKYMYVFIPFKSIDDVREFELKNNVNFKFCKSCFHNKLEEE